MRDLDVPEAVKHEVLKLEVAVDNALVVEVGEGQGDFADVEARAVLAKALFARKMEEDFAAVDVLHNKAEEVGCLERVLERGEERVRALCQHRVFRHGVCKLVLLENHRLFQHLDGVDAAPNLLFGQHHLAKGPLTQHLEHFKVLQPNVARLGRPLLHK